MVDSASPPLHLLLPHFSATRTDAVFHSHTRAHTSRAARALCSPLLSAHSPNVVHRSSLFTTSSIPLHHHTTVDVRVEPTAQRVPSLVILSLLLLSLSPQPLPQSVQSCSPRRLQIAYRELWLPLHAMSSLPSATDPAPRIKGLYQVLPYCYIGDANAAANHKDELKRLSQWPCTLRQLYTRRLPAASHLSPPLRVALSLSSLCRHRHDHQRCE